MTLQFMLQRLQAGLLRGPSLNGGPHNSRQRTDLMDLEHFQDKAVDTLLVDLLNETKKKVHFPASVPRFREPKGRVELEWTDEEKKAQRAFERQSGVLEKLDHISQDARDYRNEHGEDALFIGFPFVSLPPVVDEPTSTRQPRILAPVALVPVTLAVKRGRRSGVHVQATGQGADLLIANPALLLWIEQQTDEEIEDLFADEAGDSPWRELDEILKLVGRKLDLKPCDFGPSTPLARIPRSSQLPAHSTLIPGAVIGLFPMVNPGLIRDTKWMMKHQQELESPIRDFLFHDVPVEDPSDDVKDSAPPEFQDDSSSDRQPIKRDFSEENLVADADPCQTSAVQLSKHCRAFVLHGPPGTGKSQTITNIIGDHLARGERVLFVCDKRTALDVVKYRLDALGLGDFCGIIHDAQRDRRNFYMGLRKRLDTLSRGQAVDNPIDSLRLVNAKLDALHGYLTECFELLHSESDSSSSVHRLIALWLKQRQEHKSEFRLEGFDGLRLEDIETHRTEIKEVLERAHETDLSASVFFEQLSLSISDLADKSVDQRESDFRVLLNCASRVDETWQYRLPYLESGIALRNQAAFRRELADLLERIDVVREAKVLEKIPKIRSPKRLLSRLANLEEAAGQLSKDLDVGLSSRLADGVPGTEELEHSIQALEAYQAVLPNWTRFFRFRERRDATKVLSPLGVPVTRQGIRKAIDFFHGLRARLQLHSFIHENLQPNIGETPLPDAELRREYEAAVIGLQVFQLLRNSECDQSLQYMVRSLFFKSDAIESFVDRLRQSACRADAISAHDSAMTNIGIFTPAQCDERSAVLRENGKAAPIVQQWLDQCGSIESVLRIENCLQRLSTPLREAVRRLALQQVPYRQATETLALAVIEGKIKERLNRASDSRHLDFTGVEAGFAEFEKLTREKQRLARQQSTYFWDQWQRRRLLDPSQSRLNPIGLGLRQRLFVRGKRALKLRQMIAVGRHHEEGDPLFDLCPVWMAGPSTVAQIFPRRRYFDVIIFDEASQCRLEEALPALLRGGRVVIAGDPKQLPPTRFFEKLPSNPDIDDAETVEELTEQHVRGSEDLLSAALHLGFQEVFLDVHYRSSQTELIDFSNRHFYHGRLQPIPQRPETPPESSPVRLINVNGTYQDRSNQSEATAVVDLISELLECDDPPSIGVVSFNLEQKMLIQDTLHQRGGIDRKFARKLTDAMMQRGLDSFEGLFVKNLENVQGDQRDHIIISTTFGLSPEGEFRRNFGVLSHQGGHRRLNVLITRARRRVHVLTSIPPDEYRSVNLLDKNAPLNGRHYLYKYLCHVEQTEASWGKTSWGKLSWGKLRSEVTKSSSGIRVPYAFGWRSNEDSLAYQLGRFLRDQNLLASSIQWGNRCVGVDIVWKYCDDSQTTHTGLQVDFSTFGQTTDPIAWEMFRSRILESQGWQIHRCWSPNLFRDLDETLQSIAELQRMGR